MASIKIDRSRATVNETTATITITPSGFSLPGGPNDRPTAYSNMQYQYKTKNNTNWQDSNVITINKIGNNCEQQIEVQCRISYIKSNYTWIPPVKDPETGVTITSGYWKLQSTSTEYSDSIDEIIPIYFHPGTFSMNATSDSNSSNNIIANVLTKQKIDEWIGHYQKAYHWYNQNNTNYSIDLSIAKDETIKATWFNKCMTAMNVFDNKNYKTDYKGGVNGDLITAVAINQMNFSGIN